MAQSGFILGIIAIVFGLIGVVLYATGALTFSGSTSTG
jgi:hypothetical protein